MEASIAKSPARLGRLVRESNARTYGTFFDRTFVRGSQASIWDVDGREYIDCLACAGALPLGHNHPIMRQALSDYLDGGGLTQALDLSTPERAALLEELHAVLPARLAARARVQFCGPSGADAVEACIKLFKIATGRDSVFCFQGAYHGMTNGALTLTGNKQVRTGIGGAMPYVYPFPYPRSHVDPSEDLTQHSLEALERALSDPFSGIPKPALIILEAIQGEGGVLPAPDDWLRRLGTLARAHDVPLVVDEIQTGIGRTGSMFAFERAGVTPDAIILSKALGGGFPIAAIVYDEAFDAWQPGAHAGTFRGNQIAMATGAATLRYLRSSGLVDDVAAKGDRLSRLLRELQQEFDEIVDVRGRGLMIGIQLCDPSVENGLRADALCRRIKRHCFEHGVIVESGGRADSVLRLLPPLVITDAQIDRVVDVLRGAFRSVGVTARRPLHDPVDA